MPYPHGSGYGMGEILEWVACQMEERLREAELEQQQEQAAAEVEPRKAVDDADGGAFDLARWQRRRIESEVRAE